MYTDSYSFDSCDVEFGGCIVEFFFSSVNKRDPILIANRADYDCLATTLPWIIAGSAVGLIVLGGLLALIVLKLCLIVLVS